MGQTNFAGFTIRKSMVGTDGNVGLIRFVDCQGQVGGLRNVSCIFNTRWLDFSH